MKARSMRCIMTEVRRFPLYRIIESWRLTVLKKHRKVVDAVVVGLPDKEWGHRIHAIVESPEAVTGKELIKFALDYLPPYKIPKSFEFVDAIPRNESGKVVRSKLIEESLEKGY